MLLLIIIDLVIILILCLKHLVFTITIVMVPIDLLHHAFRIIPMRSTRSIENSHSKLQKLQQLL